MGADRSGAGPDAEAALEDLLLAQTLTLEQPSDSHWCAAPVPVLLSPCADEASLASLMLQLLTVPPSALRREALIFFKFNE